MHKFLVVFEKTLTGYSAYVPDLPGCIATGIDKATTEEIIYDSIKFHLEGLKLEDQNIPLAKSESEVLVFN